MDQRLEPESQISLAVVFDRTFASGGVDLRVRLFIDLIAK